MLRVGFLFRGGDGWLGGVNYLWNLLYAIGEHERASLQPVIVAAPDAKLHGLDALPGVEVVLREGARSVVRDTLARRVLGRDEAIVRLADTARIDVLSHSGTYGWRFPLPTLPWLADFQHRRLPQNFSARELAMRAYVDAHQLVEGTATIVSSEAARADARRYYGPLAKRLEVLRFVSQPRLELAQLPSATVLRTRYSLGERYFFLPNQFWRHKNHALVVDALAILATRGVRAIVVATGKGEDYRAPQHYADLMARVAAASVEKQFLHVGMVPFTDLAGLMRDSLAVINPSRFEGWSTTVEEARSMGKATLLSDIDVHREQAPPGAGYFGADDANALADAMERAWKSGPDPEEPARMRIAADALASRTAAFAARYREIVERATASVHR